MITVRVVKPKWCRGNDSGSALLTRGGKMCCIGFLARKLGARPKDIRGVGTLDRVTNKVGECQIFDSYHSGALSRAYDTNDDHTITNSQRMRELRVIGKEMGVRFVFVDR